MTQFIEHSPWGVPRNSWGVPRNLRGVTRNLRGVTRNSRGVTRNLWGVPRKCYFFNSRLFILLKNSGVIPATAQIPSCG